MLIECRPEQRREIYFFEQAVAVIGATERVMGFADLSKDAQVTCVTFAGDVLSYAFDPTDHNKAQALSSIQMVEREGVGAYAIEIASIAISEVQNSGT